MSKIKSSLFHPFTLLILIITTIACNDSDLPPTKNDVYTGSLVDTIHNGVLQVEDDVAITHITVKENFFVFSLENNKTVLVSKRTLSGYDINEYNWTVQLRYKNETLQTIPYFGDEVTIHPDSVKLNPYGYAPLSALITFTTPVAGKIKLTVKGKGLSGIAIKNTFTSYDTLHKIPVYGLYADYTNTVHVAFLDFYGNTRVETDVEITTPSRSRIYAGNMTVKKNNYPEELRKRLFLVENAIYDSEGEVRWFTNAGGENFYAFYNGVIAIQRYPDRGKAPDGKEIQLINLLGKHLGYYAVPHGVHHEVNEKEPGGNLLAASHRNPYVNLSDDTEDLVVEIDRVTGEVVRSWNLYEIFDPTRPRLHTEQVNDWSHLNSVEYDPSDSSIIISSKLQYMVAKFDYYTSEIKWICGNHKDWKEAWQPYLLTPTNFDVSVDTNADWMYAQHMPRITPDGNIVIYDNGKSRPGGSYTRAVEYHIDEENMTITKVWDYKLSCFAAYVGSTQKLENDNVLIGHGGCGALYEIDRAGNIIFQASMGSFYRAYPIELY